ncbi:gp53-like domain-containing protein [Burkholderia multivorans]|uniref:gp53-like domain-containing protein n=1 Tax=Burkholderia multivorans TaxID=87883 RepID=UPI0021D99EA3
MADLVEASKWEAGIYQLETSDPVEAGPDGIDNLQARQLGNRTRYLKDQHDAHIAAEDPHPQYATHADLAEKIAALVAQSPETLDTLSELAKALGNDPNFATTITNALALKAPNDSPDFTGTPRGTTPPAYDASRRLATMAALAGAGVRFGSFGSISGNYALALTDLPKIIAVQANGQTITLPPVTDAHIGAVQRLFVYPGTANAITVSAPAGQQVSTPMSLGASVAVTANGFTDFVWEGTATQHWEVGGDGVMDKIPAFWASLGLAGAQKLPSGLIFQWATGSSDSNGNMSLTLPITFPNVLLGGMANEASPGGWQTDTTTVWSFDMSSSTLSTGFARVRNIAGVNGPNVARGIAGRIFCWGK